MNPLSTTHILRVAAQRVRPLRQAVLRPHQTPEACVYTGDEHPSTGHFALAKSDGDLGTILGVASIFQEAPDPGSGVKSVAPDDAGAWRLRGMATDPEVRGQGHGAALLQACMDHARANGGTRIWCNARSTAAGFYRRMGFREDGPEFDLTGLGPHYVMVVDV